MLGVNPIRQRQNRHGEHFDRREYDKALQTQHITHEGQWTVPHVICLVHGELATDGGFVPLRNVCVLLCARYAVTLPTESPCTVTLVKNVQW